MDLHRRLGRPTRRLGAAGMVLAGLLSGCSHGNATAPAVSGSAQQPVATLQELMQTEVDTAADGVWDPVETVVTKTGAELHAPHTPQEWAKVRQSALVLAEAANLLAIDGRRVGRRDFPAEADGALDSVHIQELLDARHAQFAALAAALRTATVAAIAAIDARDPAALVKAGGNIDAVCEGCHLAFWYPNQVIPEVPRQ